MRISPNDSTMLAERNSGEEFLSQTISFLRFPLIVGVVLIHSKFLDVVINGVKQVETADYPIFSAVSYLVSDTFARVAVPLFFFFSGFLFFYHTGGFTTRIYLSKLKKRAKTLFFPYIFWNLLMILFVLLCQTVLPDLVSDKRKLVMDYSVSDWLWNFWDAGKVNYFEKGYPADSPLWFVRDLMVVMLCSPLVYCVVRWLKHYGVILLGIVWALNLEFDIPGLGTNAFFFFTFGAYFSINGKNFVTLMRPYMLPSVVLYLLSAIVGVCFRDNVWIEYIHLFAVNILLGMTVAITVTAYYVKRGTWTASKFLAASSFFVYACHEMPLASIIKIAFKLVHPHSDASLLMLYVLCPTLTILFGLSLYWVLRKLLPRFTAVITGGR